MIKNQAGPLLLRQGTCKRVGGVSFAAPGDSLDQKVISSLPESCLEVVYKKLKFDKYSLTGGRLEPLEHSYLLALFDRQQRQELEYPDMQKEVTSHVVRFIRPAPGKSFILHTNLDENNADAEITEQIEYFTSRGLNWDWKTYAYDTPPDLAERLLARGFLADDIDAVMVLDITEAPPDLLAPPSISIRQVQDSTGLQDVIQVMEQVWGGDFSWITGRLGAHLQIPDYLSVYIADIDDQPACAGWIYFPPQSDFASLWGGSTIPVLRKRGLYQAVLAARVQEARQRERRFLFLDASPMSQPIVAKHGFRLLTTTQNFNWPQG